MACFFMRVASEYSFPSLSISQRNQREKWELTGRCHSSIGLQITFKSPQGHQRCGPRLARSRIDSRLVGGLSVRQYDNGRQRAESSLITAVAFALQRRRFGHRDSQAHLCAFAGGTNQNEAPAQLLGPLAHADQTVVLPIRRVNDGRIESTPVVFDLHLQTVAIR